MLVVVIAKEILIWLAQNGVIPWSTQERPTPTGQNGHSFIIIADASELIFPHIHRASCNDWGRHYFTFHYKSPRALTSLCWHTTKTTPLTPVAARLLHPYKYFTIALTTPSDCATISTNGRTVAVTDTRRPSHHHGTQRCSPRVSYGLFTSIEAVKARPNFT